MRLAIPAVEGNAIFHSDRGSQYTSKEFRDELTRLDVRQSTGRTGSCFDNAAAESFFAVLKSEIGVRRFDEQMKMIRHQTPGMDLPPSFLAGFSQRAQKAATVLVIFEDRFTAISTVHHMINRARVFYTQLSRT